MRSALEVRARECLFLFLSGSTRKKVSIPSDWHHAQVSDSEQLLEQVRNAHANSQRVIVLVGMEQFQDTLKLLRENVEEEARIRMGVAVIGESIDSFLSEQSPVLELLDVVEEAQFRKNTPTQLLRLARQLLRKEEKESRKIGQKTLERLNQIFITLSAERNPQRLLATILAEAIELTDAEGGILHVVEEQDGEYYLKMKITNEGSEEMVLQHTNTKAAEDNICGWVVLTGKLLNLAQGTEPPIGQLHKIPVFEKEQHYKTVLAIPFKNSRNEIVAVLQLVNKKEEGVHLKDEEKTKVGSFDHEDESLINSFATQAAICMENLELYNDISGLFDGFVKAAITAIESRDPSTGGHSERVAKMTVALAKATHDCDQGIYRSVRFKEQEIRELNYAALLHDFGKIGVREEVLVKAKKLYPYQLEAIRHRVHLWKAALRLEYSQNLQSKTIPESEAKRIYEAKVNKIDQYWASIQQANEPSVLKQESVKALENILSERISLPDGFELSILSEEEYKALSIRRGSLTDVERLEVESHVRHTYQFLKMIPWTRSFKNLPEIAYAHHEKLDGSGYPRGVLSHEIPLQSKIMTISDIYDALTAADRWYKDAVPAEKALNILQSEVGIGQLDPILFEIFVEAKIYELVSPRNLKRTGT